MVDGIFKFFMKKRATSTTMPEIARYKLLISYRLLSLSCLCGLCLSLELSLKSLECSALWDVKLHSCLRCKVDCLSLVDVKEISLISNECHTLSLSKLIHNFLSLLNDRHLKHLLCLLKLL